ncbi:MAG: hypothetical protein ACI8W8_004357 [Rhodothermales bacterium]|jgi:hypothetical protein
MTTTKKSRAIGLILCLATLLLTCSGCLQSKDHLRINADGSGRWTYRVTLGPQMTAMVASGEDDGPATLTAAGVKAAAEQTKGVTLKTCKETKEGGSQTLTVDLTFESIAELASGPFAEQLSLELKAEDGQLVVYSPLGPFGEEDGDGMNIDLSSMIPLFAGFETARMITLPNPVLETNGQKRETHAAVWSFAVDANTSKDDFKKMSDMRPRVACAMTGVTMKLPVELVIPEDEEDEEEEAFVGNYVDTPATQAAEGFSLQPIHAVVRRDLHYIPTDIIAMGTPMRVTFDCIWPEDISPSGYSGLTVAAATDNSGTDLRKDRPGKRHGADTVQELKIREDVTNRARFELDFLELPARDATTYSVSGHFDLHVPKRVVAVQIEKPKALVGKPLEHPALAESAITLRRFQGAIVELSSKKDLGAITKITLSNADGSKNAKAFSTSSRSFAGIHTKSVHFSGLSKLESPVLTLMVAEGVEKKRVDFQFTDLKLP